MQFKPNFIFAIIVLALFCNSAFAEALIDPTFSTDVVKTQESKQTSNTVFKKQYSGAVNKFENLNIKISYEDFYRLISKNQKNDFYLLLLGDKTAELGFFDLSALAFSKINDLAISNNNIENTKKYYFPKQSINKSDILILAELYSNIIYNDQAKESVTELSQYPRLLQEYDYANYIMALGYYKLNDIESAKKYIAAATKDCSNINYKILESKILTGTKKGKITQKLLKEINAQKINSASLVNKINAANEFILYILSKKTFEKDYYLGRYYFAEGDYVKSARILQGAVSKNKKYNARVYSMMSRCYFEQGDFAKAAEYAKKGYKITNGNPDCLLTLGDLEAKDGNYKNAIKYYKEASSNKQLRKETLEKMASTYTKMSSPKRANDIYRELIKEFENSYTAYYKIGLTDTDKELDYLKKSVSINISFQDGWIDLARIMIDKGNIELAKNYLSVANYLDDNNFRYYYYQSLLKKKEAEMNNLRNSNDELNKVANEIQYTDSRRP